MKRKPANPPTPLAPQQRRNTGWHDWSELAALGKELKKQRQQQAQLRREQQQQAAQQQAARALFTDTIARTLGSVTPVRQPSTASHRLPRPAAVPLQTLRDRQNVLAESMGIHADDDDAISDEWEAAVLLSGDEQLRFAREHIPDDVLRKLHRGHWRVQAQLDLHNMQSDAAREAVSAFIRHSHRQGARCVRVIHGKGHGSEGGVPVLKQKVPRWLMQKKQVLAFVQAREADGGAGAVMVLLSPPG